MKTGFAGELRCIVKKKDGITVQDTGYQKNMFLDTGLDFFGGDHGDDIFAYCLIGSGNDAPEASQTQLISFVDVHTSIEAESSGSEPYLFGDDEFKVWRSTTYRFEGASGESVSEVGLASEFVSEDDYHLCTRALIKSAEGEPITITLKEDEVLEITYRIWQIFDLEDKEFSIKITDDIGGEKLYNAKCRLAGIGDEGAGYEAKVGMVFAEDIESGSESYADFFSYAGDIGDVSSMPSVDMGEASSVTLSDYVEGTYTRDMSIFFGLDDARLPVRSILAPTTMGNYQIQYGSQDDDEPIPKSKNDTLTVPIRFTWARYEGELNVTE